MIKQEVKNSDSESPDTRHSYPTTWGPWLFYGVLAAGPIFMWWLVIYDHGVQSVH